MKLHKLLTLILVSIVIAVLLGSVANGLTRVADSALAEISPTATSGAQARLPLAVATRNYMPIILLNAPAGVNCLTTTNGLTGADGGVCSGNITLQLSAGGVVNNAAHTFGLRVNDDAALAGDSAALYGTYGGTSGISPCSPSGVWGDSNNLNYGVLGTSKSSVGVQGISNSYYGVRGVSTSGAGVLGTASSMGVMGVATDGSGTTYGVYGFANASNGNGVYGNSGAWNGVWGNSSSGTGVAGSTISGTGVYATSASGFAMNANGNAKQTRDKGGWVKAMALVNSADITPTVMSCYNSQASGGAVNTPPCDFTVARLGPGNYCIDFGFKVDDRFRLVQSAFTGGATIGEVSNQSTNVDAALFRYVDDTPIDPSYFFYFVY